MASYRVVSGTHQVDGFPAREAGYVGDLAEFGAAWLAWAFSRGIVVSEDGSAPVVAEPEPAPGPLYLEHWHGDPAQAPEGTWEHKWRTEREAAENLSPDPSPTARGGEPEGEGGKRRRRGSEE